MYEDMNPNNNVYDYTKRIINKSLSQPKFPVIFLDRDGVINQSNIINGKPVAPRSFDELKVFKDVVKLNELSGSGFKIIVISNQPDVGHKLISLNEIKKINAKINKLIKVDDFFYCFHKQNDNCFCRKPLPGLILKAVLKHNLDLEKSFLLGDRSSDIELGYNMGCDCSFINYNYSEAKPLEKMINKKVNSITEFVDYVKKSCKN